MFCLSMYIHFIANAHADVSTYTNHPNFSNGSATDDPKARWISSSPVAFVPAGIRIITTAWATTTFFKSFQLFAEQLQFSTNTTTNNLSNDTRLEPAPANPTTAAATLTIMADDTATVFVNSQQVGQTQLFPHQSVLQVPADLLRAGYNLIAIHVRSTGGPAVVVASLTSAVNDGSVLLRTDSSWNWLM